MVDLKDDLGRLPAAVLAGKLVTLEHLESSPDTERHRCLL
jgi:hypothetical protein